MTSAVVRFPPRRMAAISILPLAEIGLARAGARSRMAPRRSALGARGCAMAGMESRAPGAGGVMTVAELAQAMPDVARHFWGEPNPRHSSKKELRWGTNGARSVDVAKGTWFDHEAERRRRRLDFLKRERVRDNSVGMAAASTDYGNARQRPRKFSAQDRRDLRLHRRIRNAAVPGRPPRPKDIPPTAGRRTIRQR